MGDCSGNCGREEAVPGHRVLGAAWWLEVLPLLQPGLPCGEWKCQGALTAQCWPQRDTGLVRFGVEPMFQEASPAHIGDLCILVALNYTFACVITSHASCLKLPRVILGQATITISLCCVDMTFDYLIATGFGSGPVAKAVSLE